MKRMNPYFNYTELVELIPTIQKAAFAGINRDRETNVFNSERIQRRAVLFKDIFKVIQGKWIVEVFYTILMYKECGFNDIKKALPEINSRTLTDRLKELEKRGLILRNVINERPLRVKYMLSDHGAKTMTLFVPFMTYLVLPSKYQKELPELK